MSDISIKGGNKGVLISLIVIVFLLAGGSGYLLWRVNQKDNLAPTDSDAYEEGYDLECTGPCILEANLPPYPERESYARICTVMPQGIQGYCLYKKIPKVVAYYITYTAGANGTVSNPGQNNVTPGGSISSTATPNSGFKFKQWSDGKTTATRTETNVQADATYTATFEPIASQSFTLKYTVTPYTAGGVVGGSLSGNLNQTVSQGNDGTAVTFVGNEGSYCKGTILEWLVNGVRDTTVTGNTRQEKNVQNNMNIEGKAGSVWTTDSTTFRYYTDGNGQLKLGDGTPSISPITLSFTNGQPCPGNISITAIPSNGYVFSHWNDTILNTRDTSSLVTANPRRDIISVTSSYKPNIAVTAIFVPSSGCGDGICSEGENSVSCPNDCSSGVVPQTGIFDDSKTAIITGILLLIMGISWTSIFTFSQKALFIVSSASNRIKEDRFREMMIKRRKRLEKRLVRKK
jgi:hypothetical protein